MMARFALNQDKESLSQLAETVGFGKTYMPDAVAFNTYRKQYKRFESLIGG